MGRFKMPPIKKLIQRKRVHGPKKDPCWVYLNQEMQILAKEGKKPYNNKVGTWLVFLRDLRKYFFQEYRRKYKTMERECGPPWYYEYTLDQRELLNHMKDYIAQDTVDKSPTKTKAALLKIGITTKFPTTMLMRALKASTDPGVFFWTLFEYYYHQPPSTPLPKYDLNAKLMMSALLFIDLEECMDMLRKTIKVKRIITPEPEKKAPKYFEPKVKLGVYLQKMYVPLPPPQQPKAPTTVDIKVVLRSSDSYEKIAKATEAQAIARRIERNIEATYTPRKCDYKFWEPPLRAGRSKAANAQAFLQKLLKKKAPASHLRYLPSYPNQNCHVGNVCISNGKLVYEIKSMTYTGTGCIVHNGGLSRIVTGEFVFNIQGYIIYPLKDDVKRCEAGCDCVHKWKSTVFDYLEESKCRCQHRYDFRHTGSAQTYLYPAHRDGPAWFDRAKIYSFDQYEDYVQLEVKRALRTSSTVTPAKEAVGNLKPRDLLQAYLSQLSDTPLLIPHLPNVRDVNSLQECVRRIVYGKKLTPKQQKQMMHHSQRRWADLSHFDFRARAYQIPFTEKELSKFNFTHRGLVQRLFRIMLRDFERRTNWLLIEQSRLWWSTMKYDTFDAKPFLNFFFTYMPTKMRDVYVINPHERKPPNYGKAYCPLDKPLAHV